MFLPCLYANSKVENYEKRCATLEQNISSLYETAKAEVDRKVIRSSNCSLQLSIDPDYLAPGCKNRGPPCGAGGCAGGGGVESRQMTVLFSSMAATSSPRRLARKRLNPLALSFVGSIPGLRRLVPGFPPPRACPARASGPARRAWPSGYERSFPFVQS
eukprot:scaffold4_cov247-Pinguiococcus_pyrenoidosus.AAC.5